MGLQTTRPGGIVRKENVAVAKNYLDQAELDTLNRIVNAYTQKTKASVSAFLSAIEGDHGLMNHCGPRSGFTFPWWHI